MAKKRRPKPAQTGPSGSKPEVVRMKVTPSMAARWIDEYEKAAANGFVSNRNVREADVQKYSRDMINKRWQENAETIKFDRRGYLIDGQHRLWAVIEAGNLIPGSGVWMMVAFNIEPEAMITVDNGIPRGYHDHLAVSHVDQGRDRTLSTAVRMQFLHENIGMPYFLTGAGCRRIKPSYGELDEILERHPKLIDCCKAVAMRPQLIGRGSLAWLYYQFCRSNRDVAGAWLEGLKEGVGLEKTDPVLRLRARMITNLGDTSKLQPVTTSAYAIKSWNAFLKNKPLRQLRWASTEGWPTIL